MRLIWGVRSLAQIIERVQVANFRSIRSIDIGPLSEYTPIVGLNSSGKSNIFRALSVLFTDSIDETGAAIDLGRDYSGYSPKGKRKEISVGVELALSGEVHVRGQDDFLDEHGISDKIGIRRTWFLEAGLPSTSSRLEFGPDLDTLQDADTRAQENSVLAFLRSVDFRYIPNHVRPVDVMTGLVAPVRRTLMSRLQGTREYRESAPDTVMGALARTASRMFDEVSSSVAEGIPGLAMHPMLPHNFADLAFELLISTISGDSVSRSPELEGSGAQSFMLLHFLDLADRAARSQSFGWVQASVWAFEEPESYLHSGLRFKYADDLRAYARDSRRQILLTTHVDEFVSVADNAAMMEISTSKTEGSKISLLSARDAILSSNHQAISVYRHPLSQRPDVPLVIVEGSIDKAYFERALIEAGVRPQWRIVCDEDLDLKSGGDNVLTFLKANAAAIASRPLTGPIIVVRDWEATDSRRYNDALTGHPHSSCVTTPVGLANPDLGEKFVGIERYLPTDVILEIVPGKHLSRTLEDSVLQADRNKLEKYKARLRDHLLSSDDAGPHLHNLAIWLDQQVQSALQQVPASEFLRA